MRCIFTYVQDCIYLLIYIIWNNVLGAQVSSKHVLNVFFSGGFCGLRCVDILRISIVYPTTHSDMSNDNTISQNTEINSKKSMFMGINTSDTDMNALIQSLIAIPHHAWPNLPDPFHLFLTLPTLFIYRRPHPIHTHLYQYRVYAHFDGISPEVLAKVYTDMEYRKQWDQNFIHHERLDSPHVGYQRYVVKYPYPLNHREYIYRFQQEKRTLSSKLSWSEIDVDDDSKNTSIIVLNGESAPGIVHDQIKLGKGRTRVVHYEQVVIARSITTGSDGCEVWMSYFEDPAGAIPSFIVNWAAKTGVPAFVNGLKSACHHYAAQRRNS